MVLFMAGFPFAGKTFVLNQALEQSKNKDKIVVISPKDYLTGEAKTEADRTDEALSAWEISLDDLRKLVYEGKEPLIIYDTACSSLIMEPIFVEIKKYKHQIVYVYVQADQKTCAQRAGSKWLPESIIAKYVGNFEISIKRLTNISDKTIIIKNSADTTPDVTKLVNIIDENS